MKRTVLILLSFALALGAVAAQRPPAWTPQAVAIFADVANPGAPGCAIAVYRDGGIVYERGYGIADLEHECLWMVWACRDRSLDTESDKKNSRASCAIAF